MAGELVLDTGGLVSLLDRDQPQHAACRRVFEEWTGNVVSTEAVLTEAAHLMARVDDGIAKCVEFFLAGGAKGCGCGFSCEFVHSFHRGPIIRYILIENREAERNPG